MHVRVLVLGGTGEARALAARLVSGGVDVISSLAGRVSRPALPRGVVRIGGFGGVDGLVDYLQSSRIERVVDATHPFAATITRNAVQACTQAGVPLVVLRRPGWEAAPGDRWTRVPNVPAAADLVRTSAPGTVFLTTGRRDLSAFAGDDRHHFLVRTVDPPTGDLPPRMTLLLDRGPYEAERESALMREHGVALLVTKDSGGTLTAAKLVAARELGVPVLVVDRPPLPHAEVVPTVEDAALWLAEQPAQAPVG